MAEGPRQTRSGDDADAGVLAGLPATRPDRIGRRARTGSTGTPRTRAAKTAAKAKPKAKASPKAKARPKARPRAADPTPIDTNRKPRPVRAGHPGLDGAADKRPKGDQRSDHPGLVDVATAGVKLGGRVLKGIAGRLPRP